MVLGFISRAVFIQVLGAELLGVEAVFTNLIQMLSLADLGLNSVMTFSYYKPLAENDTNKLRALLQFYKIIYLCIAATVLVIGLAIAPFIPLIVNTSQNIPNLALFYLMFVADSVISYLFVYRTTILKADQHAFVVTRYEIIINLLRTILQIAALILLKSYIVYLLVRIISTLVWNLLSARKAKQAYPSLFQQSEKLEKKDRKEILDVLKSGFVYKVSAVFLNSTTNIILSIFVSTLAAGYLSNYNLIVVAVVQVSTIIFSNLTASIGNLVVLEDEKSRLSVFNSMVVVGSWITIVFVGCTTILCHPFIALWIGADYTLPVSSEILRMTWMFLECVMQPIFSYREAVGLYRKTRYVMLCAAILNVVLSCLLGSALGLDGILIGAILSRLLTYFWYEPKILHRDYFDSSALPYFKMVFKAFLLTCVVSAIGLATMSQVSCDSWLTWIVQAAITFTAINLVCFVSYRNNPALRNVIQALKNMRRGQWAA